MAASTIVDQVKPSSGLQCHAQDFLGDFKMRLYCIDLSLKNGGCTFYEDNEVSNGSIYRFGCILE